MMHVNVWFVLTQQAKDTLRPLLDDEDYSGPHLTAVKIFRKMIEYATVEKMFKTPTIQGKVWHLFSVTFNDLNGDAKQKAQDAFDHLTANYANNFSVVGAWKWDGSQVMDNTVSPAVPRYPINQTQLLKFMPDVWSEATSPGQYVPATQLTDVNLIQGQANRDFT